MFDIPLFVMLDDISYFSSSLLFEFGLFVLLDNISYFSSSLLFEFVLDKGLILHYLTNYYIQGYGVAKLTNKILIDIINNTIVGNLRN